MKYTHRTHQARTDHELLAMHIILAFNGQEATAEAIESWEYRFRGQKGFEEALRKASIILEQAAPDFKAEPHVCGGQLCDDDGQFDVNLVRRKVTE